MGQFLHSIEADSKFPSELSVLRQPQTHSMGDQFDNPLQRIQVRGGHSSQAARLSPVITERQQRLPLFLRLEDRQRSPDHWH